MTSGTNDTGQITREPGTETAAGHLTPITRPGDVVKVIFSAVNATD